MNITFVVPELNSSGGTRVISKYAHALKEAGHQVCIVIWKESPRGVRNVLRHYLLRFLGKVVDNQHNWYFEDNSVPIIDLGFSKLISERRLPDADVVIATFYSTALGVARLSSRKGRKYYFMQDYGAPGQTLEVVAPTWYLPMHIITISQFLVDLVKQARPTAAVTLIPNSVEFDVFRSDRRNKQPTPTFGVMYRLLHTKGSQAAFESFKRVLKQYPDARLLVVGHESLDAQLPPNSTASGSIADDALAKVYASCDAWLFPSEAEGFGLPILEAMACRTPVISTPAGAAPELLAQIGCLVPVDDPNAMAEAMIDVIKLTNEEWMDMSDRSYERAIMWHWTDAVDQFAQTLHGNHSGGHAGLGKQAARHS